MMSVTGEDLRATTGLVLQNDCGERTTSRPDGILTRLRDLIGRKLEGRRAFRDGEAPAVPSSPVYELCQQYEAPEFWQRYFAFRFDPCARTWRRLRGQVVPWLAGRRVTEVMQSLQSFNGLRTPDSDSLKRALLAFASAPQRSQAAFDQTLRTRAHRPRR